MWPWKKKGEKSEATTISHKVTPQPDGPKVLENSLDVSKDEIEKAIRKIRGNGFHFAMSYAQMCGYNEKLTNPQRLGEILGYITAEPNFTQEGINFAVDHQLSELSYLATHPLPKPAFPGVRVLYDDEESVEALKILEGIVRQGGGNLKTGLAHVGFDFEKFLTQEVVDLRQKDVDRIMNLVAEKKSVLRPLFLRAYNQGRNKYGDIEYGPLIQEIGDFLTRFFPEKSLPFFYMLQPVGLLAPLALSWINEAQGDRSYPDEGLDFEHWCAAEIEKQDWVVTVSKASGDQGVDLIASRDSITVAVQCKRYNSPLGNKAVQEAYSGMRHYGADVAVVIGTGGFTRSAVELAGTTNVILLDADMINDFTEQVSDRL